MGGRENLERLQVEVNGHEIKDTGILAKLVTCPCQIDGIVGQWTEDLAGLRRRKEGP